MPDRERKGVPEHRPTANSGEANLKNVNSSWLAESQTSVCACVCVYMCALACICVCVHVCVCGKYSSSISSLAQKVLGRSK